MRIWKLSATLVATLFIFGCGSSAPQGNAELMSTSDPVVEAEMTVVNLQNQTVEASCGQCQFGLTAPGCDLAIRHDGVAYFLTGTNINDHGDAHAKGGFCNAVRTAKVDGAVVDGKFVATSFEMVDEGDETK